MAWEIYDYRNAQGRNVVWEWCRRLQKVELIKLTQRIDKLAMSGHELCPGLAPNLHNARHLHKIKLNGRVAVRLILCSGPINMDAEYTLLMGAFERDGKLPNGTLEDAEQCRLEVMRDPKNRRCLHERFTK